MRFSFFSSVALVNAPLSVNLSKEIVRSPYGLQWLPNAFKPGPSSTNTFDFSFINLKPPYSQEEQNYFSNLFGRRNNYMISYNSKVAASRFYFVSAWLYQRTKSSYANNFICSHSVRIPTSRIFFFRSNGFARGSFLVSALNKKRAAFFKKIRSLLFYSLFNKSTRFLFINFRAKAQLFKVFFQPRLKKNFKATFGSVVVARNPNRKVPSPVGKKRKTNFFKNPYFFHFFMKSNFSRNLISEFQTFYKSDDLYIFNNVRIANVTKKYTKLSI